MSSLSLDDVASIMAKFGYSWGSNDKSEEDILVDYFTPQILDDDSTGVLFSSANEKLPCTAIIVQEMNELAKKYSTSSG